MISDNYIQIKNLSKSFYRKSLNNKYDLPFSNKINYFYALDDINLDINKDEFIVIYGRNGSGKSTLLKCICDIYKPTSGKIIKNATISPIIEIGAAFHDNLSGRENLITLSLILGFSTNQINENIDEIINFSELNDYIDMPYLTYSSGMKMRLAFSIISHLLNDVLILDEVFSVGDKEFANKCKKKIHEIREKGNTIVNVTHNLLQIKDYCNRLIILEKGKVMSEIIGFNEVSKYIDNDLIVSK